MDTTTAEVSRKPVAFQRLLLTYLLRQLQFQARAEANAAEIMAIPPDQIAGTSTEANHLAAERAELDLFERAGLDPPEDSGPTDGEKHVMATEYKNLAAVEILKLNTRLTKQGTGQVMGLRRELAGLRTVQQAHSSTLREICDTLANIKRRLTNWEQQGILPSDLSANPDLNPLLGKSQTRRFDKIFQKT